MSKASEPEAADVSASPAGGDDAFDNIDFRYLQLTLEVGAGEGWDFQLTDIRRVEAIWRLNDGDATSYGFVVELRDGRRVYFDYDNYTEDEFVERVSMQPMGDEPYPKLEGAIPDWEPTPIELIRRFAN